MIFRQAVVLESWRRWEGRRWEFGAVGLLGAIGKDTLADAGQASSIPNEEWPKRWTLSFA